MNITEGKYSKSYCLKTPCSEMGFSQKASCKSQGYKNCYKKSLDEKDPKVGTGKKPKDRVSVKFRTKEDILVQQFRQEAGPQQCNMYDKRDNCGPAALDFISWAESKGIKDLKRIDGYFKVDIPVSSKRDFTQEMKQEFLNDGGDWNNAKDRLEWIYNSPYSEQWKYIPHYWVEDRNGKIYELTGQQQFIDTGYAKDLNPYRYMLSDKETGEVFNTVTDKITEGRKKKKDPKVGTGKKPKGSGRRLYTDENPKDTVSVKFRTKEDIVDTLNKTTFKNKSHKRQSQIINLIHQRVRAAHNNAKDPKVKSRFKRGLDYITNRKEKSKEKTKRLRSLNESNQTNQPLKKGDVVLVVNLDKSKKYLANGRTDLYEPKLFTPYRVFGYFHRQPQNWENPNTTQIVYKLEHLDITDEERMIDFQKGGGERLGVHLLPEDTWILQKDIQELNEGKSLFIRKKDIDERARTLGNARRQGVDTYFPKSAIRANPMRFRPYTRELYMETEMRDKDKKIMKTNLNLFGEFPLNSYKQINPPSETETRKELEFLKRIKKNEDFIYDNDKITKQYKDRLEKIGIEYPKGELKKYMNEIKKIILILKYFFNRKRPYEYVTKDSNSDLNVTLLNSAKTPSYPSGHATQSEFISQYLLHKYPQHKQEIKDIADDISKSRMIAKVHFPSDIKFGKVLGKDLFTFIKNEDIDLKEVKPATLQSNQKKIVDGFSNFSL